MSYESNFERAAQVNDLAGNTTNQGWAAADHQLKIIESEFNELKDGIADRDLHELRDGIVDVLFTVYGLAHRCGIDADQDFHDMMISQMSKFDDTEEDVHKSLEMFRDKGVRVCARPGFLGNPRKEYTTYIATMDQSDDRGRLIPKGKWLKSHKFQEPVFQPLPEQTDGMRHLLMEEPT